MTAGIHKKTHLWTGMGPTNSKRYYEPSNFIKCEKCNNALVHEIWSTQDVVYACTACGFSKSYSHVSFGIQVKVPNYISLTKTHTPDKLFFSDGVTLQQRMLRAKEFRVHSLTNRVAHEKWETWANQNTIEIVKLAALAETHTLGADPKLSYDKNPMIHLKDYIDKAKGVFLHFVTIRYTKKNRKLQKIGDAINYGLKNAKSVMWIGGYSKLNPDETLYNAAHRLVKPYVSLYDYEEFNKKKHVFNYTNRIQTPTYITGPTVFKSHGKSQKELDIYVDKLLTDLNKSLPEEEKIQVVLNTGNTGVETSVIRWAVKNNIHAVVVNLPSIMCLNEDGYNQYDTTESAINRILNRQSPDNYE